jgi:hypothetical protein
MGAFIPTRNETGTFLICNESHVHDDEEHGYCTYYWESEID